MCTKTPTPRLRYDAGDPMEITQIDERGELERISELGAIEASEAINKDESLILEQKYPVRHRAGTSSIAQREAWRRTGSCTRCGGANHRIADCKFRPAIAPGVLKRKQMAATGLYGVEDEAGFQAALAEELSDGSEWAFQ